MRKFFLFAGTFATLAAATALPAGAVTPTTFTLTAGGLGITAPTGSLSLGTQVASNELEHDHGPARRRHRLRRARRLDDLDASVISSAFTPPAGPADPASNVSYAAGAITRPPPWSRRRWPHRI